MDKLEVRLDAEQCDAIVYALALARDNSLSQQHKDYFATLRSWLRHRRIRKWGDQWAEVVSDAVNVSVSSE